VPPALRLLPSTFLPYTTLFRSLNSRRIARSDADELVESSLRSANLWNEVKDRLDKPGSGLSGGQQQRLCIARSIAVHPDVILMRSEEHTSELQSRFDLVCRLLL